MGDVLPSLQTLFCSQLPRSVKLDATG